MGTRRSRTARTPYRSHPIVQLIAALELIQEVPQHAREKAIRDLREWLRERYRALQIPESHVLNLLATIDPSETPDSIRQKINYQVPPPEQINL